MGGLVGCLGFCALVVGVFPPEMRNVIHDVIRKFKGQDL